MPNFIDKQMWKEDHHQSYIYDDPKTGKKKLKLLTPSMVVRIASKEELEAQLDHYRKPFLKDLVPDSKVARRNYVEHVRPALRYWCAKYGVDVPSWLQTDDYFTKQLGPEEKMEMFGTTKLTIKEFRPWKDVPMPGEDDAQGAQ